MENSDNCNVSDRSLNSNDSSKHFISKEGKDGLREDTSFDRWLGSDEADSEVSLSELSEIDTETEAVTNTMKQKLKINKDRNSTTVNQLLRLKSAAVSSAGLIVGGSDNEYDDEEQTYEMSDRNVAKLTVGNVRDVH